mgnify:CR=1 FL=1
MFSMQHSLNAIIEMKDRFLLIHGKAENWTTALIDYPRIRWDPNSKRSFIHGIRFRIIEFNGNAKFGLVPLAEFTALVEKRVDLSFSSIQECARGYSLTYWGSFQYGGNTIADLFSGCAPLPPEGRTSYELIRPGDTIEFELKLAENEQQITISAWSSTFSDPLPFLKHTITLEDNITYCWAISAGMPGSQYVVEKAWTRLA